MARKTRQLAIFPLATTTVGWVPDRTPEAEAKRRTRSEAESCAGGLPTDNPAKGEAQGERHDGFPPNGRGSKAGFQPNFEVCCFSLHRIVERQHEISLSLLEQRK